MAGGRKSWASFARYTGLAFSFGVTMAVMLLLGFYGGRYLDQRAHTQPLFMTLGVLLGAGLALKSMLDEINAFSKEGRGKR